LKHLRNRTVTTASGSAALSVRSRPTWPGVRRTRRRVVTRGVVGGLVAGAVDVGAAALINHQSITFILHAIAGGLLAEKSFAGGGATALLGALLQEAMGALIGLIFGAAGLRAELLLRRWVASGLLYGAIIFVVMNFVVVPLSAWHRWPHFSTGKLLASFTAMLLFGLIIACFCAAPGRESSQESRQR